MHELRTQSKQDALANKVKYMAAVHELEISQKEFELQKKELEYKTQELNMATYYLQQRNQLLTDLQETITEQKKKKSKADVIIKTVTKQIKQASAKEESEKVRFREKFDEAQREFISRLHMEYTALSNTECRVCALLRSGFNTKEIANLLSSSGRTIENHRANIRKKMDLSREDNLNLILAEIK
jgi:DNA-binding NarL/FixJ family response regulator